MSDAGRTLLSRLLRLESRFTWDLKKKDLDLEGLSTRLQEQIDLGVGQQSAIANSYSFLAYVRYLQGRPEEAASLLSQSEEKTRECFGEESERRLIVTYGDLAWLSYHSGDFTQSDTYCRRVEDILVKYPTGSPTVLHPEVYGEKAWTFLKFSVHYYPKAIICFLKALELQPDDSEWNAGYAITLCRKELIDPETFLEAEESPAVKQLRRALEIDPDDAVLLALLALKLSSYEKHQEAESLMERVLEIGPDSPHVTRYVAKYLRQQHTETLNIVFLIYFRILKKAQKSVLLPAVLEGLANFAHLINLEFFDDLLNVLQNLIQSGDLTNRESLHCIQTAFNILSGQGDVLNIDPLKFYSHLYKTLLRLHAGAPNGDIIIVLRCLDVMLTRRRKQVSLQRAMAFVKRLSTLSLHVLPNASVGILASNRAVLHAFPKCDLLLDNEVQGSGFFLPELDEPEHCNPQNTALWELHSLQRHFHPAVRRFAVHLCHGAPSDGSAALGVELSRRSPVELFEDYSVKDMTFNPPVATPSTKKKDRFGGGTTLLDADLQSRVERALTATEEETPDFTAAYTHTHTESDT